MGMAIHTVFNPAPSLLIQPVLHQLLHEDLTGDNTESPAEIRLGNINCSPLTYQASHFIVEGYQDFTDPKTKWKFSLPTITVLTYFKSIRATEELKITKKNTNQMLDHFKIKFVNISNTD